jgi:hypothetical protein
MDGEKLCPVGLAGTDRCAIGLRGARVRWAAGPRRRRVGSVVTVPATWTIRVGVGIGCIAGVRRQEFVEFVVVEAGSVERIAPTAMWESEFGSGAQILDVRLLAVVPRGVRGGGPRHDDVGSHAIDTGSRADFGDLEQYCVSELDSSQD